MSILIRSAIVVLLTLLATAYAQSSFTVVADPWCPFNCTDSDENPGIMIELVQAAMARHDISVNYQNINWARAGRLVIDGDLEAIVGTSKSPSSDKKFHFPKIPLSFSQLCFYRKKGNDWTFNGAESLKTETLGWINLYKFGDTAVDKAVQEGLTNGHVVPVSGEAELIFPLIRMLETERISTFGEVMLNVDYAINSLPEKPAIEVAGCLEEIDALYVAFSPNKASSIVLANKLDDGMRALLEERTQIDQIMSKYGVDPDTYYDQLKQSGIEGIF